MNYPYQYASAAFDGKKIALGGAGIGFKPDGSEPFSIDAFVRMTETLTEKEIISKPEVFSLGISGNKPCFRLKGFPEVKAAGDVLVPAGEWTHICVVFGKPHTVLYVDGIEAAAADLTGTGTDNGKQLVFFTDTVGNLRQVRFFNSALTAEKVTKYMLETDLTELESVSAFFDFSQVPAVERVKSLSVALQEVSMYRLYSKGALFSGNALLDIEDEPLINPGGKQNDSYTVQAWVYFHESEDGVKQTVFSNGDVANDAGISLYIERIGNEYKVRGLRGTTGDDDILTSRTSVKPNCWLNLAVTYAVDTMELYIDGVLDNALGGLLPIAVELEHPHLHIGAEVVNNGMNGQDWFSGCIARLDIWERKLSAAEIANYGISTPAADSEGLQAAYAFHQEGNVNSRTGCLLGEHNRFAFGEISYPFSRPDNRIFREINEVCPADEITEPLSADTLAGFRKEALNKRRDKSVNAMFAEMAERQGIDADPETFLYTVTSHIIDENLYFVAHTADKSYTVYHTGKNALTPEQQWYVELFLILIGGFLTIVFGYSLQSNQRMIDILLRLVVNPAVRVMFADEITFSVLLAFIVLLYKENLLMDILKAAFYSLSWWKVAWMISKFIMLAASWAIGGAVAYYITAIGALVIEVVYHITQKPTSSPPVGLAAVQFNHSSAVYTVNKLKLDAKQDAPVPEWTSNRTDSSHAAYCIDKISGAIVLRASLKASWTVSGKVRCRDAGTAKLLGDSNEVTFSLNKGNSAYYDFTFSSHSLTTAGITYAEITLVWEYYNSTSGQWDKMIETRHHIYNILSAPYLPWNTGSGPWAEVLKYACQWANGKKTVTDAAAAITKKVNDGLGLKYEKDHGASQYIITDLRTSLWYFTLSRFIEHLKSRTYSDAVNCVDCATITSTFANALGCMLSQKRIAQGFDCNPIISIGDGDTVWKKPFEDKGGKGFNFHEICLMEPLESPSPVSPANNHYRVYDACLKVNGSATPDSATGRYALLPAGMRLSQFDDTASLPSITIPKDESYREHLADKTAGGIKKCHYCTKDFDYYNSNHNKTFKPVI